MHNLLQHHCLAQERNTLKATEKHLQVCTIPGKAFDTVRFHELGVLWDNLDERRGSHREPAGKTRETERRPWREALVEGPVRLAAAPLPVAAEAAAAPGVGLPVSTSHIPSLLFSTFHT